MTAAAAAAKVRVALDATPLLGLRTGVGTFCAGAMEALGRRPDLDVRAFAVSWRRRGGIVGQLPDGVAAVGSPMPARPLHLAWRHLPLPPVEWWTGPLEVVHGTNFVVPPSRRAAQVVTVHDLTTVRFPELCEPVTLAFPELVRRAVARGAWVHTPSAAVAAEVVELLGVDPERVRPVHHGVPPVRDLPIAPGQPDGTDALLPPGTDRYVLALGTVEPRKDLPGLVRAFDAVAGRHPGTALVAAGRDGWGTAALEVAIKASPYQARIVRLGYVGPAQRDRLLAGATVFAYPSVYEGFGFPPLEAMALGVPVVSTTVKALVEVLGDGACLVPPGDSDRLAEAIDHLLADEPARLEVGRRGRRRTALFCWDKCAEGLVALYRDAMAARG